MSNCHSFHAWWLNFSFLVLLQLWFLVKHDGNLSMSEILDIARQMHGRSISRNLAGTVKQMLGTAQSVGCTVEGEPPHDIIDKINEGEIEIPVSSFWSGWKYQFASCKTLLAYRELARHIEKYWGRHMCAVVLESYYSCIVLMPLLDLCIFQPITFQ